MDSARRGMRAHLPGRRAAGTASEGAAVTDSHLEQVKEAARRAKEKWPGNTDSEKACRAIEAYERGFVELKRYYGRDSSLKLLDPNKGQNGGGRPTMFNVSERSIRRVETIRESKNPGIAALESAAMNGELSLELVEWVVNHPPSADTLEAIWLASTDKDRAEFIVRIKQ